MATKFRRIRNDVAVTPDGSRLEFLVSVDLEIVVVFITKALVVVVDRTIAASAARGEREN
eukprot:COSAG02_NODE_474_length_21578_cov_225.787746_20_plen_60_part_00